MKVRSFLTGIATLFLFSCEKSIDFKLKDTAPKLVVEATIENDKPPFVILTNSVGYFSEISPEILASSFVHSANVLVSNGTLTQKLKEYRVPTGNSFSFYYYSIDSSNTDSTFLGELNHSYSLQIDVDGKLYTANTTIPAITKKIDSLWWKPVPGSSDTTKVIVMVRATDKPGYGDYIRYFTKRNSEPFYPALNSVFDDLFIDGTTYELQVEPGVDRNATRTEDDHYFSRGDTVIFKLSNIDKATYDFWRTMEFSYQSVGNPFSTPTKVLSNISNNALGYFGGYGTQYRTLIIPH